MTIDTSKRSFLGGAASLGVAAATLPLGRFAYAAGKPVEPMTLLTSNASFDPVRPEMGRLIAQACKSIGWDVTLAAEDYNMDIIPNCLPRRVTLGELSTSGPRRDLCRLWGL